VFVFVRDYKILFNYLRTWQRYAVLCATWQSKFLHSRKIRNSVNN